MNSFVLDCSVAMRWCFEDEAEPATDAVYAAIREGKCRIYVPVIFFPEIVNTLLVGERRGRCTPAKADEFLQIINKMPIYVDKADVASLMYAVHPLARSFQLTGYDACYLELAMRLAIPLATRDKALLATVDRAGVALFQPSQ